MKTKLEELRAAYEAAITGHHNDAFIDFADLAWELMPQLLEAGELLRQALGEIKYLHETGDIRDSMRNSNDLLENARAVLGYLK